MKQNQQYFGLKYFFHPGLKSVYKKLLPGAVPGPDNNIMNSVYLDWNSSGQVYSIKVSNKLWNNRMANFTTKGFQSMKKEAEGAGTRSMENISTFNMTITTDM